MAAVYNEWDPESILELLLECGRMALDAQAAVPWTLKRDGSLVTTADQAVEHRLAAAFDQPGAGSFLIGEETVSSRPETYVQAALANTAWIVDPIDGTAPYAHGFSYWGVSIGFARGGILRHGALILPGTGEVFITAGDRVHWAAGVDVHAPRTQVRLAPLTPCLQPLSTGGMVAVGQRFMKSRVFTWPNPVVATGCAINALAYLMLGRLMGCIGFMYLWDLAGVLPMLARTGIAARLGNGTALTTNLDCGAFILEAGQPERWALRDQTAFGAPAVVDALVTDILGGRPGRSAAAAAARKPTQRRSTLR
jgi:myo-inositol-1(or 4)-monophosphatase